ncbi:PREDICTED: disease resistance protein RPS6-like [Camelina sativa]|uniref:Disease resistance protein RPS6-like n=1 Tax=Camelina sativa TaxID=90675 RepID=A0ABM0X8T6_CAMSA|nr:PREDICTED: disease resistance protein RPS6-like [Camelina sativa]
MASSSSSSRNWVYDIFPSFSGEDVRITFLSHFLKELDQKLIKTFKDNKIERSHSIAPELVRAIRTSKIAVVVFSENYSSSSWCLDELVEIVKCKEESGQLVIPVFYGLDPSHVRKQTGKFGEAFAKTCQIKTKGVQKQWQHALILVANLLGYHSHNFNNEATMIEVIANDLLGKLKLTPSKDFKDFAGIEYHIAEMSLLLHLESEEARMVGIWGPTGIGKTTIARALFSRLSRHFQGRIFIDRGFISKNMKNFSGANPDDYNMKLSLQGKFLSEILGTRHIQIDHLGAIEDKLKHQKVLIFIDDVDDQVVLDTLVGEIEWFGCGSRIVAITKDKHLLRAHNIFHIYEVCLPSQELSLEMFCRSAFKQKYPPDGFMEVASKIARHAGNLPLGLNVLGSYLRGIDKEEWVEMLPSLRSKLNGKIEKTLRVSYDGLNNEKDEKIFRHIVCLFDGAKLNDIKQMLGDSDLDVTIGLKTLVDKSLVHVNHDTVKMHTLLQEMGKEIVRAQSNEPGEREFLVDSKDIYKVLKYKTGTEKVLGISLDINETDELHIHESAFKGMHNLCFITIYIKKWDYKKEVRWHLAEGFDYFPPKLRLLRLDGYPMRCLPSNFRPEHLVKLTMRRSKLEKLWEGVHSLTGLKDMNLDISRNLKELPDLSMATNLEELYLGYCSSLVELPSSIQYLHKLKTLDMSFCANLKTLPTGVNLESLDRLNLMGCSRLKSFPNISTSISKLYMWETTIQDLPSNLHLKNLTELNMCGLKSQQLWKRVQPLTPLMTMLASTSLTRLWLSDISSLVELPSSIQNLSNLKELSITKCINLETLPTGINLESLDILMFSGCSRLTSFPNISTNISTLDLEGTSIEEVPWWIENFHKLKYLILAYCNKLKYVSLRIFNLTLLDTAKFLDYGAFIEDSFSFNISPSVATSIDDTSLVLDNCFSIVKLNFINYFNLDQEALIHQESVFKQMILIGEEVPSYFIHRTTGTSLAIPLLHHISPSQPSFRFRACVVIDCGSDLSINIGRYSFFIQVRCQFIDIRGNQLASGDLPLSITTTKLGSHLVIFECCFPLNEEDNAPLAEVDHVDIQFHLIDYYYSQLKLKGCGIRLPEDSVVEAEYSNECGVSRDINVETERSKGKQGQKNKKKIKKKKKKKGSW